jgi:hypothetical protein
MRFWTLMYLAYMFWWCIFEVHGAEFEKAMMTSFYDRMKLVPLKPGEFDIAAAIKYWFGHLDLAATAATKKRAAGEHRSFPSPTTRRCGSLRSIQKALGTCAQMRPATLPTR